MSKEPNDVARGGKLRQRRAQRQAKRAEDRSERKAARAGRRERRRRSPEVARQELLDAAERVFLKASPDQVGLKVVAREAGVSHALITHYFGTYQGLIEATLQRRLATLRERFVLRLADASVLSRPEELLAILFRAFEDPVHLRLMKWMVASERPAVVHSLTLAERGLQLIAHQVANALAVNPSREVVERVELTLMTAVAAALGYAVAKYALAGAAGKQVSNELDEAVQTTLAGMVRTYMVAQLPVPPQQ